MRLSTWINPLPGAETSTADRLVALRCAMQITPDAVVDAGAAHAGDITTKARKFEAWLAEAADDQDHMIRRAVLVMVCDKANKQTSHDRIRALVKELHHYVTRR